VSVEQPPDISFACEDGIFVKQMYLKDAMTVVPQHAHEYDHISMLAVGSVRAWADGELMGEFAAPCPITIRARVKHTFLTLEPGTTIYCIHNTSRTGEVEIHAEHQIGGLQCLGVS
jgi:hypothetical protein